MLNIALFEQYFKINLKSQSKVHAKFIHFNFDKQDIKKSNLESTM